MHRHLRVPAAILSFFAFCSRAHADLLYTFNTDGAAPGAGPLSGSFSVASTSITDGFISAPEISALQFKLTSASTPFFPVTYIQADDFMIYTPYLGQLKVDPITGSFPESFNLQLVDPVTNQVLFIGREGYQVFFSPPNSPSTNGQGHFTIQQIPTPEPATFVFLSVAGTFFLFTRRSRARFGS